MLIVAWLCLGETQAGIDVGVFSIYTRTNIDPGPGVCRHLSWCSSTWLQRWYRANNTRVKTHMGSMGNGFSESTTIGEYKATPSEIQINKQQPTAT